MSNLECGVLSSLLDVVLESSTEAFYFSLEIIKWARANPFSATPTKVIALAIRLWPPVSGSMHRQSLAIQSSCSSRLERVLHGSKIPRFEKRLTSILTRPVFPTDLCQGRFFPFLLVKHVRAVVSQALSSNTCRSSHMSIIGQHATSSFSHAHIQSL